MKSSQLSSIDTRLHIESSATIAQAIGVAITNSTLCYTASPEYVGYANDITNPLEFSSCGNRLSTHNIMEIAKINYKRRFKRMSTPMNAFIAICRYLRDHKIRSRKQRIIQIAFHLKEMGHGYLLLRNKLNRK